MLPARSKVDLPIELRVRIACVLIVWPPPFAATGAAHPEPDRGTQREGSERLRAAIDKLKSLHDGVRGVIEIVACGRQAVPALRALLFEREPSGLYQPRCLAVRALAVLEAYDVLVEYLNAPRAIADPVERVGEDAVINAAARALAGLHEARIFELLMSLAETRPLPGVVGALGRFGRTRGDPISCRSTCRGREPAGGRSRAAKFRLFRTPVLACRRDPMLAAGRARERVKLAAAQKRAPAVN